MTSLGRFGPFGGRYVPETLVPALEELDTAWRRLRKDASFRRELGELLETYAGRPTPLFEARRFGAPKSARIFLKREDLCHTGAHKINNTLGQVLIAKKLGKQRVVAETGAGQHGVATASACALFGIQCRIYMGAKDVARQSPNVVRMRMMGAEVIPVTVGSQTLKDALNEALRDWVTYVRDTHYILGTAAGPHPFPTIVSELQSVIGRESRRQFLAQTGRLPHEVVACVGGGSNAVGMLGAFVRDKAVKLVVVEAGGHGLSTGEHGASLSLGKPGVLHGSYSYVLQDAEGQISEAHSVSAGLDYPGVGPQLAQWKDDGRLTLATATDEEALESFELLGRTEGILPALESAHALSIARRRARKLGPKGLVLVCLSGRGDKDLSTVEEWLNKREKKS